MGEIDSGIRAYLFFLFSLFRFSIIGGGISHGLNKVAPDSGQLISPWSYCLRRLLTSQQ